MITVLALALSLVACGSKPQTAATPETTVAATEAAKPSVNLEILKEQDNSMINTYTLLAVNDKAPFVNADGVAVNDVKLNTAGADALINFMLGEGEDLAANFGYNEYGEYLFYLLDTAPKSTAVVPKATDETKTIRLSTTTSVNDSGLLGYLLPIFEN